MSSTLICCNSECGHRTRLIGDTRGAIRCPLCRCVMSPLAESQEPAATLDLPADSAADSGKDSKPSATLDLPPDPAAGKAAQPAATLDLPAVADSKKDDKPAVVPNHPVVAGSAGEEHPTKMGRFEIRRFVGEGSFGIVYLAYDPQLDREVALKVAKKSKKEVMPLSWGIPIV